MTTRRLQLTLDDQARQRYPRVEFDVPAGTAALEVRLSRPDDAVVDLGCEGPAGWRGWSGGARRRFAITRDAATPGYLDGAPEPGQWAVVLGLHQLPDEGADVEVSIDLGGDPAIEPQPLAPVVAGRRGHERELPAAEGLTWFAGDCHAHTHHSDGAESVDELAARAAAAGLDFVAVTDHNTVSHWPHLAAASARHGVTLLPGQEVTTHRGHATALGDVGFVDFRRPALEWVRQCRERGGLLSVNHPLDADCAWQHPLPEGVDAVELWHVSWFRDLTQTGPWAWQRLLGPAVVLGGSDFHAASEGWTLGTPTTWVAAADASPAAILAGLRAGRTAISVGVRPDATPDPFATPVLSSVAGELIADAAAGLWLVDADDRRRRVTAERQSFAPGVGPHRLETPDRRVMAITSS